MKSYKVNKSSAYTDERKNLIYSYTFTYFNIIMNDWLELRNGDTKTRLKEIILNDPEKLNTVIEL